MGLRPTLFTCTAHILVLHTYLYYTCTCTTHSTSYIKAVMYILLHVKYNTIHSISLTWYQSHCSKLFLCLAVLSLLVFSTASNSLVSKLFVFLPIASPLLEVLKVESPPPEALFPPPKTIAFSGLSIVISNCDTRNIILWILNWSTQRRWNHPHLTIHVPPRAG